MSEWTPRLALLEFAELAGIDELISSLKSNPIKSYSERYRANGGDEASVEMLDKLARIINERAKLNVLSEETFRKVYTGVQSIVLGNGKV